MSLTSNIRNFSIIAHIDHGKSTLADRMLEITGTIEKRRMREQFLDQMDLERERGITIKMQPVRMEYHTENSASINILNLIDTPGHIDFSYEVSRAIKAVEGAVLLVDATQGVQAQTIAVLDLAREAGLTIIPAINKIDLSLARVKETKEEITELLGEGHGPILEISGKTGEGVKELLDEIVRRVPAPKPEFPETNGFRGLVFDFEYSAHRGVVVFFRVLDGEIKEGDDISFSALGEKFTVLEVGVFMPEKKIATKLSAGEIGYAVTGIKRPIQAAVGDTLIRTHVKLPAVSGYQFPRPVVWASLYPEEQDDFVLLRQALERLRLSDSSLSFEEESSGALGRGFRVGFLGMLHMEIVSERLKREFNLSLVVTTPTIGYEVTKNGKAEIIYNPVFFPDDKSAELLREPWIEVRVITPPEHLGNLMTLFHEHEAIVKTMEIFGESRNEIMLEMPLRELMRNFFDDIKSATSGYASISYKMLDLRVADVVRMDILVGGEPIAALARIVPRNRIPIEAERVVDRLKKLLPRQMFDFKIQAQAVGRIIASHSISGMKKQLGDFGKNGGDITRKMKLWAKQKKGKEKMKATGRVNIPEDVFLKMMRRDD